MTIKPLRRYVMSEPDHFTKHKARALHCCHACTGVALPQCVYGRCIAAIQRPSSPKRWLASLYPRLSPKGRQRLLTAGFVLALALQSNGFSRLSLLPPASLAAQLTPQTIGDDFQVNSYTTATQSYPAVASDSNGNFVVVWQSSNAASGDTSGHSIQAQRYNSQGVAQGSQFQVNDYTTNNQLNPSVAMDSNGDFVVTWQSTGSPGNDNVYNSIQARLFNSSGTPLATQFQVNSFTNGTQNNPSVAMDSDGDFVVVWQSDGAAGDASYYSVQGARFNSVGVLQGSQFQANTLTTNDQELPAVAMDSSGNFVVVWESQGSSGSDNSFRSIQRRRYNSGGTALDAAEIQVNAYTTNRQNRPAVAMDSDGDFVVAWESYLGNGGDPYYSIQAQRFNSNGTAQNGQFQVNSYTTNYQYRPAVGMDSDGDFVIVWDSSGSNGSDNSNTSIQGRVFSDTGLSVLSEFQVNQYTTSGQTRPAVAVDSDGDFIVAWQSNGSAGGDTASYSIQAQQLDFGQIDHQANNYTTGNQSQPAVASDGDGDFVIVWQSDGSVGNDNDGLSIQARLYDGNGLPKGWQFQVNSYTTGNQFAPAVAMDNDGDFVVVWQSNGSGFSDTASYSIQAQRFNSLGTPQGSQFEVNTTYTTNAQRNPDVSLDYTGNFVIVWESGGSPNTDSDGYSIQGQRYNSNGDIQSGQFQVNDYTTGDQTGPAISLDDNGNFIVVWLSQGSGSTDNSNGSIQGRRFNSSAVPASGQFQVNSYITNNQSVPDVSLDSDGDFVVVWQSNGASGDTSSYSIQGQRYDSTAALLGSQFQVNAYTTNAQAFPAVSRDSDGDFVVVWQSNGSSGNDSSLDSIQARRYNNSAVAQGDQFQVNSYTTNDQSRPAVSLDSSGDFVLAWQSAELNFPPFGPESDADSGIAVSRFSATGGPLPTAVNLGAAGVAPAGTPLTQLLAGLAGLLTGTWLWLKRRRSPQI